MSKLINEVSELTGMSAYNLRFYEEEGLLSPQRTGATHYRVYSDEDINRIFRIRLYRELGIAVKDMKILLDSPGEKRVEVLDEVIRLSSEKLSKIKYIKKLAEFLKFYASEHENTDDECKKEFEEDYERLVLILGKQINEFYQYYEEQKNSEENLEG